MKNFLIVVQFSIYLKIQFVGNPSTGTIARYVGYLVLVYGIIEIVSIDSYENRIVKVEHFPDSVNPSQN